MKRLAVASMSLLVLGACGDPLGGIDRVSQGADLPAQPGAQALPSEDELTREGSILADLLQRSPPDTGSAPETSVLPEALVEDGAHPASGSPAPEPDTHAADSPLPEAEATIAQDAPTPARTDPARSGPFGWLRQVGQGAGADEATPVDAVLPLDDAAKHTVEEGPTTAPPDLVEPEKRRGLFANARSDTRTGPDAADVAPGTVVPFGQIARNCAARPATLGKVVDKAARKGRGYVLFDTAPDTTEPRTFYVTGFSDNCPRQFTAALALFGDPAFHEQLRYGLPAEQYPYSSTDKAYEKLKRRVCNVGRNTPCGDRIDRLSRNTTFISAYEQFTDNGRWADMLLHDGVVLAASLKTP